MTLTRRAFIGAALATVAAPLLGTTAKPVIYVTPAEFADLLKDEWFVYAPREGDRYHLGSLGASEVRMRTTKSLPCHGDCGVEVYFDLWDMNGWVAVHYWPSKDPQKYEARLSESEAGAYKWFDATHGRSAT